MANYIVTGSDGFIGRNLCERLLERGHGLVKFDVKHGMDLFSVNKSDLGWADGIFHLACVNQEVAELDPYQNERVNDYAAGFLADKAFDYNIPLIYTSTASIYGNADNFPTSVTAFPRPESIYAKAKLRGEVRVRKSGCHYKIFRLSNVYGPYQTPDNPYCGVIGKFCAARLLDEPLKVILPGNQTRDFTFVDDVVSGLILPKVGWDKTYNLSTGKETSVLELAHMFSENIEYVEPRSVDTIERRCIESSICCPTKLESGIQRTLEWSRANG